MQRCLHYLWWFQFYLWCLIPPCAWSRVRLARTFCVRTLTRCTSAKRTPSTVQVKNTHTLLDSLWLSGRTSLISSYSNAANAGFQCHYFPLPVRSHYVFPSCHIQTINILFSIGGLRTSLPTEFTFGMTVLALTCLSANTWASTSVSNYSKEYRPLIMRLRYSCSEHCRWSLGLVATGSSYYAAMSMIWTAEVTHPRIRLPLLLLAPSAQSPA